MRNSLVSPCSLILILCLSSCATSIQFEGALPRNDTEDRPVESAFGLLREPPPTREWIKPAPSADPYANLTALLQQGNPAIRRPHVVQFVQLAQGVPTNLAPSAYQALVTPALTALVTQFYTPTIFTWLLANQNTLLAELESTRRALALPPGVGHWKVTSNDTRLALMALWGNWKALAEYGPALLRPLLPGFEKPDLFVFSDEKKYDVGLLLRKGKTTYRVTRDRMVVQQARGLVDLNDESLVLFKGEYIHGKVVTSDVVATKRYRSLERLSGGGDLEPVWDLESSATLQFGVFRAGWSTYARWAGVEWSGSGSWWDLHAALGYPYAAADATIRTPREYPIGFGIRLRGGALWTSQRHSLPQLDLRASPGIWIGPQWARVYGGFTVAAVPTRVRGRIRGALIRRHVGVALSIDGWDLDVLIEPPRARWLIGYGKDWWRVSALGDVVNGLPRYGGRVEAGPFTATVLFGLGLEASGGFQWDF